MPRPQKSDMHVNTPLTNMSVAYIQDASEFIATKIFPLLPVNKQSDSYFRYDIGDFSRDEMEERAPATESVGSGYDLDTDTYNCKKKALHKDVPEDDYGNADTPLDPDKDAVMFLTKKALINSEKTWHDNFFKTGVWHDDIEGVASGSESLGDSMVKWSDATDAKPVKEIGYYQKLIKGKTGFKPNCMAIGVDVFNALKECDDILNRVKYTQRGIISTEILASLFELDLVLVSGGVYNSAAKGATDDLDFFASDDALLCYINPYPSPRMPSAGYTMAWKQFYGGNKGYRIKKFYMEELEAFRVEVELALDQKQVSQHLGIFFDGLI